MHPHAPPTTEVTWAPVYLEPLPGSGERITILVCVLAEGNAPQCFSSLGPSVIAKVFPGDHAYVTDLIEMVRQSLYSYTRETNSLRGWVPPLEGVELGAAADARADDLTEVVSSVLHHTSFLYRPEIEPRKAQKPKKANWTTSVRTLVIERDERLKPLVDARVCLANVDVPSEFSFLSHNYAANLVSFLGSSLLTTMREARAKAWSLDQLDQAPSILFKPENRELLAGMPGEGSKIDPRKLSDCIDELRQEASRRNIGVLQFDHPEEAADHIIERHHALA